MIKSIREKMDTHLKWSLFCVGQLCLEMGPYLDCGWYTQGHSTEENRSSLSQPVSITNSFLVRDGTLCPLPFLPVWFCPVWTCACYQVSVSSSVYQSCWVWKMLSLEVSITSGSYLSSFSSSWIPDPWEEGFDKDIPFKTGCSKVSFSAHCLVMGLR